MTAHRLARSDDGIVAGVCSGIAEFLGWQPISIRALFVLLFLVSAGGFGVAYLLLWWMMPRGEAEAFRLDDFRVH